MPGPTVFHLVRHASHGLLDHVLAGRMPGVGLSGEGRAEAAGLGARLTVLAGATPIGAVVASPLQRAQETAAPIAAALGVGVQTGEAFTEVDFGAWTGQRFEDLAPDPGWSIWNRLRSMANCPGGETMIQAQSRALMGLGRLRVAYPDRAVVVVSHADIIKVMLAPALGLSIDLLHRVSIAPASISTLVVFDEDVRVDGVNR